MRRTTAGQRENEDKSRYSLSKSTQEIGPQIWKVLKWRTVDHLY